MIGHDDRFHWEEIDDELGEGIRYFLNDDEVYEARDHGDLDSRIYHDGETWHAKLKQTGAGEDAYDAAGQWLDELEEYYGGTLTGHGFDDDEPPRDAQAITADGTAAVTYTEDTDLNVYVYVDDGKVQHTAACVTSIGFHSGVTVGVMGGLAAGVSYALGVPFPMDMVAPFVGGSVGASLPDSYHFLAGNYHEDSTTRDINDAVTSYREERKKEKRYVRAGLLDETFFTEIERRVEDPESTRRSPFNLYSGSSLRDLASMLNDLTRAQFEEVEEIEGATAAMTADDYEEAAEFIAAVMETPVVPEEPSVFMDQDAFETMMEQSSREQKKQLLRSKIASGSTRFDQALEEEYWELLREAGIDLSDGSSRP